MGLQLGSGCYTGDEHHYINYVNLVVAIFQMACKDYIRYTLYKRGIFFDKKKKLSDKDIRVLQSTADYQLSSIDQFFNGTLVGFTADLDIEYVYQELNKKVDEYAKDSKKRKAFFQGFHLNRATDKNNPRKNKRYNEGVKIYAFNIFS